MYAIAFDMEVDALRKNYGDPYNNAYLEIQKVLKDIGFNWVQGSVYIFDRNENPLSALYSAIESLKNIEWFKKSVRDIRAFKVEDWSDFTDIVKERKENQKTNLEYRITQS